MWICNLRLCSCNRKMERVLNWSVFERWHWGITYITDFVFSCGVFQDFFLALQHVLFPLTPITCWDARFLLKFCRFASVTQIPQAIFNEVFAGSMVALLVIPLVLKLEKVGRYYCIFLKSELQYCGICWMPWCDLHWSKWNGEWCGRGERNWNGKIAYTIFW